MKTLMAFAAVAVGMSLSGCMADNSYNDNEGEMHLRKEMTDWRANRPIVGATYNESANAEKETR